MRPSLVRFIGRFANLFKVPVLRFRPPERFPLCHQNMPSEVLPRNPHPLQHSPRSIFRSLPPLIMLCRSMPCDPREALLRSTLLMLLGRSKVCTSLNRHVSMRLLAQHQ